MNITKQQLPVIKLDKPYPWGSEQVSEIKYQQPIVTRHLYELDITLGKPTYRQHVDLAGLVTDQPVAFINQLPAHETAKIVLVNLDFLQGSQLTGQPSWLVWPAGSAGPEQTCGA